ncbi:hypothetical protein H0H92_000963 [Tricholoma furcatifolium]|nr:hypothetical protein H0H92_000963 [Tricholoma furcatifolium]
MAQRKTIFPTHRLLQITSKRSSVNDDTALEPASESLSDASGAYEYPSITRILYQPAYNSSRTSPPATPRKPRGTSTFEMDTPTAKKPYSNFRSAPTINEEGAAPGTFVSQSERAASGTFVSQSERAAPALVSPYPAPLLTATSASPETAPTNVAAAREPITFRMNSFRAPGDATKMNQPSLHLKLNADLRQQSQTVNAKHFKAQGYFPPVIKGHCVTTFIKDYGRYFLDEKGRLPRMGLLAGEEQTADYLNHIVSLFYRFMKKTAHSKTCLIEPKSYWTGSRADKLLRVGPWDAKPDILLVPVQEKFKLPIHQLAWPWVGGVGEISTSEKDTPSLQNSAATRAFLMLYTQGNRYRATTIAMNAQSFAVHIFDRSGKVTFAPMSYTTHLEEFVTYILTITYTDYGLDTESMVRKRCPISADADEFPNISGEAKEFDFVYYSKNPKKVDTKDGTRSSSVASGAPYVKQDVTCDSDSVVVPTSDSPSSVHVEVPASHSPPTVHADVPASHSPPTVHADVPASHSPPTVHADVPASHSPPTVHADVPASHSPPTVHADVPASHSPPTVHADVPASHSPPTVHADVPASHSVPPIPSEVPASPDEPSTQKSVLVRIVTVPEAINSFKRKAKDHPDSPAEPTDASEPTDVRFYIYTEDSPYPQELTKAELEANLLCNVGHIIVKGTRYLVKEELFRTASLVGRGTRVWRARALDATTPADVIIKESWILSSRTQTEAKILEGSWASQLPQILAHNEQTHLSTRLIREANPECSPDSIADFVREKRRIVSTPCCVPITDVKDSLELVALFLDYSCAIKILRQANRMHRDISHANLMIQAELYPGPWKKFMDNKLTSAAVYPLLIKEDILPSALDEALEKLNELKMRRGILIDFDYASYINPAADISWTADHTGSCAPRTKASHGESCCGARTGTPPYMAIPLLLGASCHTVAYDLESLFYSLVYVVTHVPEDNTRSNSTSTAVDDWFRQPSLQSLAALKLAQFNFLQLEILSCIHPKFVQLTPYICALWQALYPHGPSRRANVIDFKNMTAFKPEIPRAVETLKRRFLLSRAVRASNLPPSGLHDHPLLPPLADLLLPNGPLTNLLLPPLADLLLPNGPLTNLPPLADLLLPNGPLTNLLPPLALTLTLMQMTFSTRGPRRRSVLGWNRRLL